jgi:hypothetical protein
MATEQEALDTIHLLVSTSKTDIIPEDSGLFKTFGDKLDAVFLALKGSAFGTDAEKAHFFFRIRQLAKEIQQDSEDWRSISFLFAIGEADSKVLLSLVKQIHKNTMIEEDQLDGYVKTIQDIFA